MPVNLSISSHTRPLLTNPKSPPIPILPHCKTPPPSHHDLVSPVSSCSRARTLQAISIYTVTRFSSPTVLRPIQMYYLPTVSLVAVISFLSGSLQISFPRCAPLVGLDRTQHETTDNSSHRTTSTSASTLWAASRPALSARPNPPCATGRGDQRSEHPSSNNPHRLHIHDPGSRVPGMFLLCPALFLPVSAQCHTPDVRGTRSDSRVGGGAHAHDADAIHSSAPTILAPVLKNPRVFQHPQSSLPRERIIMRVEPHESTILLDHLIQFSGRNKRERTVARGGHSVTPLKRASARPDT